MKSLRIVFMGTPDFAVNSLMAICQSGHHLVGVVTTPDKPAGRGQKISVSPIKEFALSKGLKIFQPQRLKDESFLTSLRALHADLFVVVAFRMLPEAVWRMPPFGTINLHGSLLPKYRGAAPIHRAIMNGEKETGVTTFFLTHEIDTGHIIHQETVAIGDNETTGALHDRMKKIGAEVLMKTIDSIAEGTAHPIPQSHLIKDGEAIPTAPKIFKEDGKINWNQPSSIIHHFIRGLSPYPAAWTVLNNKTAKIFLGKIITEHQTHSKNKPGEWHTDGKTWLRFFTSDGEYEILEIQMEGKKKMTIQAFLNGQNKKK